MITGARLKVGNRLEICAIPQTKTLKLNQDFVPFSFSLPVKSPGRWYLSDMVRRAGEFGYDDYAHLDVNDKICCDPALRTCRIFCQERNHAGLTAHSQLITKAINARNHGAKAVILINGKLGDGEEDLLTKFGSVNGPENAGIVIVQVKNDVADVLVCSGGKVARSHSKSNQFIIHRLPHSRFPTSLRVSLDVNIEKHPRHREQRARLSARQDR